MSEEKNVKEISTVFTSKATYFDHNIYLTGEILEAGNYTEVFNILRNAQPDDGVTIYINSCGGDFWTAIQYMAAIKQCKATVDIQIDGTAHSAASLICLSGDNWVIPETASMLCHHCSTGIRGKMGDIENWHKHTDAHFKNIMTKVYKGFLTDKELASMLEGKEFWFGGSEIRDRIKRMLKVREAEEKKAERELKNKKRKKNDK